VSKDRELVIGGYVPGSLNFDSIIVGYYTRDDLRYVARVRNGFVPEIRCRACALSRPRSRPLPLRQPASEGQGSWGYGLTADKMKECRWLKPKLVAQIEYAEWTEGNHLRHSKFIGLRDDKEAREVRKEG
jgi:bifunctional non-homologous end joining protein LigD